MLGAWMFAISALAAPEDISLSGMAEHGGQHVSSDISADYQQLIRELGVIVSNKPLAPAGTLGASGFDLSFSNTFAFITATRSDGTPSPWERAQDDENPNGYSFIPTLSARKGLPLSIEVGANATWIGLTRTGTFGGFGRVALVEGYKPWPDVSLEIGYSGYVGDDELELGVMNAGVNLGSSFAFGSLPGVHNAQWKPFLNASVLRISASPLIDATIADDIGAVRIGSVDGDPAIIMPRFAGGFTLVNGTALFRVVGTWAPKGIATATVGMGVSY